MLDVRAYSFDRWPSLTGEEVAHFRRQSRGGPLAALLRGSAEAATWLGARPILTLVGPPVQGTLTPTLDPIVALILEHPRGRRAALVLDGGLASCLVDRTLGGEGEGLEAVAGPLRDLERGVLSYAVARWLAGSGSRFAVATVLSSAAAASELLGAGPLALWRLEVQIGNATGSAALWSSSEDRPPELPRTLPSWAGPLPIELTVRASTLVLGARDLAELRPGDVVVPDRTGLTRVGEALTGEVWLQPVAGTTAWRAELQDGGLRIGSASGTAMSVERVGRTDREEESMKDADRVLETLGDTPVTLSLELARFALPLSELAGLAPGEVVRTGAPIGERVALRAGDQVVATGELVEVEGEIGVRILELAR